MCDEPNRAGDERLTGDMDRLPHSLAALGSSSSFLISWSNRSSSAHVFHLITRSLRFGFRHATLRLQPFPSVTH